MLVLLPVFLLFFSILIILVLQRLRPGLGTSWTAATGVSVIVWGIILAFYWWRVAPFEILGWNPVLGGDQESMIFVMDHISWPINFCIASLLLSVMLTDSVRLQEEASSWGWIGSLAIAATGILAGMADSIVTILICWTIIDLIELGLFLYRISDWYWIQRLILSFAAKLGGTMLVLWAMISNRSLGQPLDLENVVPSIELLLIIGVGFRLGLIPLNLPYVKIPDLHRGFGVMVRLVTPVASLAFLSRLPKMTIIPGWAPYLLFYLSLIVLYGAVMWISCKDSLEGGPYWLVVLAGMALACVIKGQPLASISWITALIISGGVILLYSAKNERLFFIPALAAFGISGLPFSLSGAGWEGLFSPPFTMGGVLFFISNILLLFGYLRHAVEPGRSFLGTERWVLVIYPFGLLFLIASSWFVAVEGFAGSFTIGMWWASGISVACSFSIFFGRKKLFIFDPIADEKEAKPRWWLLVFHKAAGILAGFFQFETLYSIFSHIYRVVKIFIQIVTNIIEGDAGVLWALLLLALVATLIRLGGGQ